MKMKICLGIVGTRFVWLSRHQRGDVNLQKREKGSGVPAASPMLKLAKKMEKIRKPIGINRVLVPLPFRGFFFLYFNFSLIFGKIILSCWR